MANKKSQAAEAPAKAKSVFREYAEAIFIAFFLALFIRTFIIQAFKIPSGSMEKTLLIGDHLLVSKFSYGVHVPNEIPFLNIQLFKDIVFFAEAPERHDIIVFKYPRDETKDFIKRVIGLPGEILQVKDQKIYINNKLIEDPHARHTQLPGTGIFPQRDNYGPMVIPDGHVFVMGDNRENSQDSRFWGFLDVRKIRGKAQMIYWSWDRLASWVRFDRMGKTLE
jgi:signal peptidase I